MGHKLCPLNGQQTMFAISECLGTKLCKCVKVITCLIKLSYELPDKICAVIKPCNNYVFLDVVCYRDFVISCLTQSQTDSFHISPERLAM